MKRHIITLAIAALAFAGCFASQGGGGNITGPIDKFIGKSQIVPIPALLAQAITTCAKGQTSGNAEALVEYNFWVGNCTGAIQQSQAIQLGIVGTVDQGVCGLFDWSNGTSWQLLPSVVVPAPALAMCPVAVPSPAPTAAPATVK
jgi:hypothetical protein